jgi:MOSC domain-containing protein
MWLAELWRYPVKSMAGEPLEQAELLADGIAGDRLVQVYDARGRVVTSRTRPRLLGHKAVLGPDGEPLVDGRPWRSEAVAAAVSEAAGPGAKLRRFEGEERFDVLPLLVATDGAIAAFGRDRRRLRPNLVIGGVEGLAERSWEGRVLRIGGALVALEELRQRCVMTTFDPDTQEQDVGVLRDIHERFGGSLALNAAVLQGGRVQVGDPVELAGSVTPSAPAPDTAPRLRRRSPDR